METKLVTETKPVVEKKWRAQLIQSFIEQKQPEEWISLDVVIPYGTPLIDVHQKISMEGHIAHEAFLEFLLEKLRGRNIRLSVRAWKGVFDWYTRQFKNDSGRGASIALEMLYVICQLNKREFFEAVGESMELDRAEMEQMEDMNFDKCIREWSHSVLLDPFKELENAVAEDYFRPFLGSACFVRALLQCVTDVIKNSSKDTSTPVSEEKIREIISDMKIYFTHDSFLAGLTVRDGILICCSSATEICTGNDQKSQARLLTLIVHETAHYLIRALLNDYSFSTPFSYLKDRKKPRKDRVLKDKFLELGRDVELLIFDGIQPDWYSSSVNAAAEFIKRVRSNRSFPPAVIQESEHKRLDLLPRGSPSVSFGGELNLSFTQDKKQFF